MGALKAWMSSNRLRLNSAKTQFIWLGTRQQLAKLDMAALAAAFPLFTFSSVVRDLGVTLDQELTFAPHINLLSRDCFYQLRQLRTVARSLTASATSTLIHAFVPTRLDYCCSVYAGLPAVRLGCLDRILRHAAPPPSAVCLYSNLATSLDTFTTFSTGYPLSSELCLR